MVYNERRERGIERGEREREGGENENGEYIYMELL